MLYLDVLVVEHVVGAAGLLCDNLRDKGDENPKLPVVLLVEHRNVVKTADVDRFLFKDYFEVLDSFVPDQLAQLEDRALKIALSGGLLPPDEPRQDLGEIFGDDLDLA